MSAAPEWLESALTRARPASDGGSYTHVAGDEACAAAARLAPELPLAGLTFAVKDLIAVAGRPRGAGSAARFDAPPEPSDAPVVAALRAAGAVCVGTTTLHELAFGPSGVNAYAGTPVNPRDPGALPGGSSSGSATAVAEGSAAFALGTDTGGSIRIPAALCGVVGFKPALGTYATDGVLPLSPTLDHVGLLARNVREAAIVHAVLADAGPDHERPPTRIGVVAAQLEYADDAVAVAVEERLRLLERDGCALREVTLPDPRTVLETTTAIMFAEAATVHARELRERADLLGADVRARLQIGAAILATDYVRALRERTALVERLATMLADVDCLVEPTVPIVAPPLAAAADPELPGRLVTQTRLANVTGHPAISLPLGDGIGLQVSAATNAQALAHAAWIERRASNPLP